MNINNQNTAYFNFAKKLFSNYNILQIPNELSNNFFKLSLEYGLEIPINKDIRTLYNEVINKYYHNEITIKSNFINNVLLKSKNHITIFEFNLETSRADLCKINGKSIAFEIKTDLDNLSRLEKQINDYSKVFEEVYVICSKPNISNVLNIIPYFCGIYSYSISKNGDYIFKKEKKSIPCNNINSLNQLKLLTKKELKDIFTKFNYISGKELMIETISNTYSSSYINSKFKKIIKQRYCSQWEFLKDHHNEIYEIDYQWFFKNNISPNIIYQ
ncbi:sce7726 family protein [Clostridium brassicae]|uniref:Sce7726 family protein n=1 Tax=Clostridium brassicae TaxID=2999072 RepID=A0ABT4D9A9_9CLOT|nr:sce7726 family protein [Clostridium brassicae]MCY6958892.1 sce7726 family protein [Clostridium brassicae]